MDQKIVDATVRYVQQTLATAEGGHDWWHVQRVWHNARQIAEPEGGNRLIIELGALLHDIADAKFHDGDEEEGPRRAKDFLENEGLEPSVVEAVVHVVRHVSFRKGTTADKQELAIVQDADRLDALGAIGIARTFSYGGFKNQPIYDPSIRNSGNAPRRVPTTTTINHFYEKLLLLKNQMNTATGRQLAEERHRFMEQYLEQFFRETNTPIRNP